MEETSIISKNNRTDRMRYLNWILPTVLLIVLLYFAAWVRFEGITHQGITSGDSFSYLAEAKLWADGQTPSFMAGFYRPVTYFLQGMAIKVLGYNDYSIKILHSLMDMINILLVFFIGAKLARNLWPGLISSLLYGFLPKIVHLSRDELMHSESTMFVLLAVLFLIFFVERKNPGFKYYLLLGMSGLCSGLAANTHEDLALLAPGFVIFLLFKTFSDKNKKGFIKPFILYACIFSFAFLLPYLVGFLIFGVGKVIGMITGISGKARDLSLSKYGGQPKYMIFINIFYFSLLGYFGKRTLLFGLLLIGVLGIIIYRRRKKIDDQSILYLPVFLLLSYAFGYTLFFKTCPMAWARIFMPLLPLLIFLISTWYFNLSRQLFSRVGTIVFVCLFVIAFMLTPKALPGKIKYKSFYRPIYDVLENKVDSRNRLLIAPAAIYSFDFGYRCPLYFGENAIYMIQLPLKDEYNVHVLEHLLDDLDIRYIFIGKRIHQALLKPGFPVPNLEYFRQWFSNKSVPYLLKDDLHVLHNFLKGHKGKLIYKSALGSIFYLPEGKKKESPVAVNN